MLCINYNMTKYKKLLTLSCIMTIPLISYQNWSSIFNLEWIISRNENVEIN